MSRSSSRDLVDHVAVVDRQILEPRVGGLDDDLGLEAGGAQRALDAEHLVADGVAVAERREDLVDARRVITASPGPPAAASTTSRAGGSVAAPAREPAGQRLDRRRCAARA